MKNDFKRFFNVIIYIIGILILAGLIQKVGLDRWGTLLRGVDKLSVLSAVMVYAVTWLFRTLRLRSLLRHTGIKISVRRIFEIHIAGFAISALLPAKVGDVAMVGFLKKEGVKIATAAAIVIQTRILDVLALVLVMIPSWFWLINKDAPMWMVSSFLLCLLLVAVPFGITWADKKRKVSSYVTKAGEKSKQPFWGLVLIKIGEAYDAYHGMACDRPLMLFSVLFSVIIWMFEGGACYALVRALGIDIPLEAAILAVALGNTGKGFQVTPGGIGVYEGILTAVLCEFGAPFDAAVTVAVLDHLLKKGFNMTVGFYALMRLRGSLREVRKAFPD